jgi:predicted nucleotidyltransferase component of viral defense system
MFERAHHRLIASILGNMDINVLRKTQCFFGGGTAISMQLGEYRKSVDIDFLIGNEDGYRWLRNEITETSFGKLFRQAPTLAGSSGVRKDRHGIRALLSVGGTVVKFEIVSENRITLQGQEVEAIPVPVVDRNGLFAEKLLATADRWAAPETYSRDIIDLAYMVAVWGPIPATAFDAARHAYGSSVDVALAKAIKRITNPEWLDRCCNAMEMNRSDARQIVNRFAQQFTSEA